MDTEKNSKEITDSDSGSVFRPLKNMTEKDGAEYKDEQEYFAMRVSLAQTSNGEEGIKVRTMNIATKYLHGPGIWIPRRIDLKRWFQWFYETLSHFIRNIWQREFGLNLEEQLKKQEEEIARLRAQVYALQEQLWLEEQEKERLKQELHLAQEVTNRLEEFVRDLREFEALVDQSVKDEKGAEKEIKDFLVDHSWILGLDCEIKVKEKRIDPEHIIDLHFVTDFNQHKIFEFKSPGVAPFVDNNKKPSPEFARGIHQLIKYMWQADIYSDSKNPSLYGIPAPVGVLVIGYKLPADAKRWLKEWNRHLRPHIQIVTYDELIESAKRTLETIRAIKERERKKDSN